MTYLLRTIGAVMIAIPFGIAALGLMPVQAQEPTFPGCHCGTIGYVDLPATSTTVSNAALLAGEQAIEGWGFQYPYGALLDRVDIYVEDNVVPNTWHPVQEPDNLSTGYARPDVFLAYVAAFPGVSGQTGFARWINNPLPLGAHRFLFVLWSGPYHTPTPGDFLVGPPPPMPPLIKTLNVVN